MSNPAARILDIAAPTRNQVDVAAEDRLAHSFARVHTDLKLGLTDTSATSAR
jgi:hypothetical protein